MIKSKVLILLLLLAIGSLSVSLKKEGPIWQPYFELIRPEFSGDLAYKTTAFVEKFWRVAGNTGFNKTVYQIAAELEKAGYILEEKASSSDRFTYRIEKRALKNPTWEPIDASLSIIGDSINLLNYSSNRNMIFQNSSATPEGGIIAEVIYLDDSASLKDIDVKGKIVFAEMSPYQLFEAVMVKGEALGLITYNNPAYLQPEKNSNSIQFRRMPYDPAGKAWALALSFEAKEKLKAAVLKGKTQLKVNIKTKSYSSKELTIIADIKGSQLPKESLVFSAHIQEPGANDNATGVGTQLEMAVLTTQLIQEKKLDLKRSLTFLWGDEIISTRRYIGEKDKRKAAINWGISLDMVGENTDLTGGSFLIEKMPDPSAIWTRGKDKHSEWGGSPLKLKDMKPHYLNDLIIEVFKAQGKFAHWSVDTNPFEGGSDHTPFLRADIPGLLLWHFTDQFYHTDNDRLDKVSQKTMQNVGTAALASAFTLLNGDKHTSIDIIELIVASAKERLQQEFLLSKQAIVNGSQINEEVQIIAAWNDWYIKTLATVDDLEPGSNKDLGRAIKAAQKLIDSISRDLLGQLKN